MTLADLVCVINDSDKKTMCVQDENEKAIIDLHNEDNENIIRARLLFLQHNYRYCKVEKISIYDTMAGFSYLCVTIKTE